MTFCVIGGGPTGVELTGIIAELAQKTLPAEFRAIDTRETRVLLVEAGPRVLPAFPERLSAYAADALTRLGAEVRCGAPVTDCDDAGIRIGDEPVPARTVIWAAGVQASEAARWLDAPADRAGRVLVEPDLTVPGMADVFVIGDTAHVAIDGSQVPRSPRPRSSRAPTSRRSSAPVSPDSRARPLRLPPPRPRDGRAQRGGDRLRADRAEGMDRLVDLGRRPHLLPDRHLASSPSRSAGSGRS